MHSRILWVWEDVTLLSIAVRKYFRYTLSSFHHCCSCVYSETQRWPMIGVWLVLAGEISLNLWDFLSSLTRQNKGTISGWQDTWNLNQDGVATRYEVRIPKATFQESDLNSPLPFALWWKSWWRLCIDCPDNPRILWNGKTRLCCLRRLSEHLRYIVWYINPVLSSKTRIRYDNHIRMTVKNLVTLILVSKQRCFSLSFPLWFKATIKVVYWLFQSLKNIVKNIWEGTSLLLSVTVWGTQDAFLFLCVPR